jgi:GrpB-like predicted nucleotidyltransferase (UPF0157 family)
VSIPAVILKNYDPNWEVHFEKEKNKILSTFSNKMIQIEHIGSKRISI